MSLPPTERQGELLAWIRGRINDTGVCPSFEEMRVGIGAGSKQQVSDLLNSLEQRGHVRRLPNRYRAIELLDEPALAVDLNRDRLAEVLRERFAGLHLGFELTPVQAIALAERLVADRARFVEAKR